jgi:hypothetical protein
MSGCATLFRRSASMPASSYSAGAKQPLRAQSQFQDVRAAARISDRRCLTGVSRLPRFSPRSLHGSPAVCGRRFRSAAVPRRSQWWPRRASIFARATCEPPRTRPHSLAVSKKLFTFLEHQSGARQAQTKNKDRSFAAPRTMTGSNKTARRIGPSWKLHALLRREGQAAIVAWPSAEERVEYDYEVWRTSAGELLTTRSRMPLPARIFRFGLQVMCVRRVRWRHWNSRKRRTHQWKIATALARARCRRLRRGTFRSLQLDRPPRHPKPSDPQLGRRASRARFHRGLRRPLALCSTRRMACRGQVPCSATKHYLFPKLRRVHEDR